MMCFDNNELINYDQYLRHTLAKIVNIDLSDDGWEQASLPVYGAMVWECAVLFRWHLLPISSGFSGWLCITKSCQPSPAVIHAH